MLEWEFYTIIIPIVTYSHHRRYGLAATLILAIKKKTLNWYNPKNEESKLVLHKNEGRQNFQQNNYSL